MKLIIAIIGTWTDSKTDIILSRISIKNINCSWKMI